MCSSSTINQWMNLLSGNGSELLEQHGERILLTQYGMLCNLIWCLDQDVPVCFEQEPNGEVNPGFMLILNTIDKQSQSAVQEIVVETLKAAVQYLIQSVRRIGYLNAMERFPLFGQTLLSAMLARNTLGLEALRVIERSPSDGLTEERVMIFRELAGFRFATWPAMMVCVV